MIVGIDLGTTFSVIVVSGQVKLTAGYPKPRYLERYDVSIVPDPFGNYVIPSAVWEHPEQPGELIVGALAKDAADEGHSPIMFSKRNIGTNILHPLGESQFTARQVAREILVYLKGIAEEALGERIDRAVVTHPAYFDPAMKEETVLAAQDAGFDFNPEKHLLMEPAAAALAYTRTDTRDPLRILTYDLGGGTFDVTVMERREGSITIKAFGGNRLLGGFNFDRQLARWMLRRLQERGVQIILDENSPADRGKWARLLHLAEDTKHKLARAHTDKIPVQIKQQAIFDDDRGCPIDLMDEITREQFEALIQDFLDETIYGIAGEGGTKGCSATLAEAGLTIDQIDEILLVGGSTYGPWVAKAIKKAWGREARVFEPDLCVAAGAAIYGTTLLPAMEIPDKDQMEPPLHDFERVLLRLKEVLPSRASDSQVQSYISMAHRLENEGRAAYSRKNRRDWAKINTSLQRLLHQLQPVCYESPKELPTPGVKLVASALLRLARRLLRAREAELRREDKLERFQGRVNRLRQAIDAIERAIEEIDDNADPKSAQAQLQRIKPIVDELSKPWADVTDPALSLTKEAESEQKPATFLDENVQFTVYRPRSVQPEQWYPLLAFAHLGERPADAREEEPDPLEEVKRQASQILGEQAQVYKETTQESRQPVPRHGELTFVPEIPGVEFNPRQRSFVWLEPVHREEFRLRASPELDGRTARGSLMVFLGSILLAEVTLSIRVDSTFVPESKPVPFESDSARRYRNIFPSYSHRDVAIVQQFERYALAMGDRYLRDVMVLRAGQDWSNELEQKIGEADVFQLFWSWNSMGSEFVENEWRYAMSLGRAHFIRPVYWEEPLPESHDRPPDELKRLHFQRILVYSGGGHTADGRDEPGVEGPPAALEGRRRRDSTEEAELQRRARREDGAEGPSQLADAARLHPLEATAREASARGEWDTAIDNFKMLLKEGGGRVPDHIRRDLAECFANRAIQNVNRAFEMLRSREIRSGETHREELRRMLQSAEADSSRKRPSSTQQVTVFGNEGAN